MNAKQIAKTEWICRGLNRLQDLEFKIMEYPYGDDYVNDDYGGLCSQCIQLSYLYALTGKKKPDIYSFEPMFECVKRGMHIYDAYCDESITEDDFLELNETIMCLCEEVTDLAATWLKQEFYLYRIPCMEEVDAWLDDMQELFRDEADRELLKSVIAKFACSWECVENMCPTVVVIPEWISGLAKKVKSLSGGEKELLHKLISNYDDGSGVLIKNCDYEELDIKKRVLVLDTGYGEQQAAELCWVDVELLVLYCAVKEIAMKYGVVPKKEKQAKSDREEKREPIVSPQ